MISPVASYFILRYFDAIDKAVSKRLVRKRPWSEPALTSLLCDLLDGETQDEQLEYSLEELNKDLAEIDGLLNVSFTMDTYEYNPTVERFITQSDIGFILNFKDNLLSRQSWSTAWLLQAKRLQPNNRNPIKYNLASNFCINSKQKNRINELIKTVKFPFVKYLLYCPRPSMLNNISEEKKLCYLRNQKITNLMQLFDHIFLLELYKKVEHIDATFAAGIFINNIDNLPSNLGKLHQSILSSCLPLAWFIILHLFSNQFDKYKYYNKDSDDIDDILCEDGGNIQWKDKKWVHGIVSGNSQAIDKLIEELPDIAPEENFYFLPKHRININITVGEDIDPNDLAILLE